MEVKMLGRQQGKILEMLERGKISNQDIARWMTTKKKLKLYEDAVRKLFERRDWRSSYQGPVAAGKWECICNWCYRTWKEGSKEQHEHVCPIETLKRLIK